MLHVYKKKLRTIEGLHEKIRSVIEELGPEMCQQVIDNYVARTESLPV